MRTLRTVF